MGRVGRRLQWAAIAAFGSVMVIIRSGRSVLTLVAIGFISGLLAYYAGKEQQGESELGRLGRGLLWAAIAAFGSGVVLCLNGRSILTLAAVGFVSGLLTYDVKVDGTARRLD